MIKRFVWQLAMNGGKNSKNLLYSALSFSFLVINNILLNSRNRPRRIA